MASSPVLHPSVRQRHTPRMSATALAEYLILRPHGQQNILHDSKFSHPPIITANGEAMRALCRGDGGVIAHIMPLAPRTVESRPTLLWPAKAARRDRALALGTPTSVAASAE